MESSCQWSLCPKFDHDRENQQQKQPLSCTDHGYNEALPLNFPCDDWMVTLQGKGHLREAISVQRHNSSPCFTTRWNQFYFVTIMLLVLLVHSLSSVPSLLLSILRIIHIIVTVAPSHICFIINSSGTANQVAWKSICTRFSCFKPQQGTTANFPTQSKIQKA